MSKNYPDLSLIQRCKIEVFLKVGMKQKMIAKEIGVDLSKVRREFSRNVAPRGRKAGNYVAFNA